MSDEYNPRIAHDAAWAAKPAERAREEKAPKPNGAGPAEPRFKFQAFRDIKLDRRPPFTVRDILPRVGVAVVWGKEKSGKTFWVFDLEMHVALGWEYRGHRVEQGTVLHIACEGVNGLGARRAAWHRYHTRGLLPDEIEAIDAAPFHLCNHTALDLIHDAEVVAADIILQFGDRPIKIITVDTLNRSLTGSESDDRDMGAYLRAAIFLADKFQCLVLIIHHCGHDTHRARGHSSLLGNSDVIIEIKKDADNSVVSEVEAMRDGPSGVMTRSTLKVVEVGLDENLDPITSCVIVDAGATERKSTAGGKEEKPLTDLDRLFLITLERAIAKYGLPAPEHDDIPRSAVTVTDECARGFYLTGTSADGQPDNTRRAAFRRARDRLIVRNKIGFIDNNIWIIEDCGT